MKTKLFFLFVIILFISSRNLKAQSHRLKFEQIGWSIKLPKQLRFDSQEEIKKIMDRGSENVSEATENVELDTSKSAILFNAHFESSVNTISASIQSYKGEIDSWIKDLQIAKDVTVKTYQNMTKGAIIDTVTTQITINDVVYDKFYLTQTVEGQIDFTSVSLSRLHKGYDFTLWFQFTDKKSQEIFEQCVLSSKFYK